MFYNDKFLPSNQKLVGFLCKHDSNLSLLYDDKKFYQLI